MTILRRIWLGMTTATLPEPGEFGLGDHAGTNFPVVLIVNQDGIDKLHHTFAKTTQDDQKLGAEALYEVDVHSLGIATERLNDGAVRIGTRGSDIWCPEHLMLWGEAADTGELQPLAIATDLAPAPHVVTGEALGGLRLSTDAAKGLTSYPLRKMRFGFRNDVIHRLLVVEYTPDGRGTSVAPELTIETTDPEMDLSDWTLGPVGASGKACFHMSFFFTVLHNGPFTRDRIKAVTLRNTSRDAWRPANLFLFGFTSAPTVLIPIVYMPEWNFGFLSTDRTEGDESVSLPLAAPLDRLPPRPVPDFPVEDIHIQVSGKRGPFTLTYSEIG